MPVRTAEASNKRTCQPPMLAVRGIRRSDRTRDRPDRLVVEPGVLQELTPMRRVVNVADPKVQRTPRLLGFVVAADVVAEQIVGEQQVSGASLDLLGLGQVDRRIGTEHLRALIAEV